MFYPNGFPHVLRNRNTNLHRPDFRFLIVQSKTVAENANSQMELRFYFVGKNLPNSARRIHSKDTSNVIHQKARRGSKIFYFSSTGIRGERGRKNSLFSKSNRYNCPVTGFTADRFICSRLMYRRRPFELNHIKIPYRVFIVCPTCFTNVLRLLLNNFGDVPAGPLKTLLPYLRR